MAERSLRERALGLLARREHSRVELARKLARHGHEDEIVQLLDQLQNAGLLSDVRYATQRAASGALRFGDRRLRHDLARAGVDAPLIEQAMDGIEADEGARAAAVWRRRFGAAPADVREYARQARFLQGRGFSGETIRRLLREPPDDAS